MICRSFPRLGSLTRYFSKARPSQIFPPVQIVGAGHLNAMANLRDYNDNLVLLDARESAGVPCAAASLRNWIYQIQFPSQSIGCTSF